MRSPRAPCSGFSAFLNARPSPSLNSNISQSSGGGIKSKPTDCKKKEEKSQPPPFPLLCGGISLSSSLQKRKEGECACEPCESVEDRWPLLQGDGSGCAPASGKLVPRREGKGGRLGGVAGRTAPGTDLLERGGIKTGVGVEEERIIKA